MVQVANAIIATKKHTHVFPIDEGTLDVIQANDLKIGECIRQGDIYLHRVVVDHPHGIEQESNQLAQGTGIGARHTAEGYVKVYKGTDMPSYMTIPKYMQPAFTGPYIEAKQEWTLEHPEHQHFVLPAGCYQVTYQIDLITKSAVAD